MEQRREPVVLFCRLAIYRQHRDLRRINLTRVSRKYSLIVSLQMILLGYTPGPSNCYSHNLSAATTRFGRCVCLCAEKRNPTPVFSYTISDWHSLSLLSVLCYTVLPFLFPHVSALICLYVGLSTWLAPLSSPNKPMLHGIIT